MKKQNGFTLFELVTVVFVMSIIGMLAAGIINLGIETFSRSTNRTGLMLELNTMYEHLSEDIPMAMPGDITVASSNRFKFSKSDGQIVDYHYTPGLSKLSKTAAGKTRILSKHVSNLVFTYSKSDGSPRGPGESVNLIRRVSMVVTLISGNQRQDLIYAFFIRNK